MTKTDGRAMSEWDCVSHPINQTDLWLRTRKKAYLADAAKIGRITYGTALTSALNLQLLRDRLADWDRRRLALIKA